MTSMLSRRRNRTFAILLLLFLIYFPLSSTASASKSHNNATLPHILFVIIDDLGSYDLGRHGTGIFTPFLDELALNGGMTLDNYYVLPYCSPTRASILSGRYPLHHGVHTIVSDWETQGLPLEEETLPQLLQNVGYQTHGVGKWHVGHSSWEQTPTFRGFSSWYGFYHGAADYFTHIKYGMVGKAYEMNFDKREFCGDGCSQIMDERGNYSTHVFTRRAIEVIEDYHSNFSTSLEEEKQPLFLYVAHQAVHQPTQVPASYQRWYQNRTDWTQLRKAYAGMLTAVDESIYNISLTLYQKGLWENTLVIVTTDNGGPTDVCAVQGSQNVGRGGKCTLFDGGTRGEAFVGGPFYVATTKAKAKSNENTNEKTRRKLTSLFHAVDWLPTLANLTGAVPNGVLPLDGVNQWQALTDSTSIPPRTELFIGYSYFDGGVTNHKWYGPAVRSGRWKLIQGLSGGPEQQSAANMTPGTRTPAPGGSLEAPYLLYDLEKDPMEQHNVALDHPDIVEQLRTLLQEYQATYVPPQPLNPHCPFPGWNSDILNNSRFGPTWRPWCSNSSKIVVYS